MVFQHCFGSLQLIQESPQHANLIPAPLCSFGMEKVVGFRFRSFYAHELFHYIWNILFCKLTNMLWLNNVWFLFEPHVQNNIYSGINGTWLLLCALLKYKLYSQEKYLNAAYSIQPFNWRKILEKSTSAIMSLNLARKKMCSIMLLKTVTNFTKSCCFYLLHLQYYICSICIAGRESNPCEDIKEIIYFSVRYTNVWLFTLQYIMVSNWRHENWLLLLHVTYEIWCDIYKYFSSYRLPDGSNVCFPKLETSFYDNRLHLR